MDRERKQVRNSLSRTFHSSSTHFELHSYKELEGDAQLAINTAAKSNYLPFPTLRPRCLPLSHLDSTSLAVSDNLDRLEECYFSALGDCASYVLLLRLFMDQLCS